LSLQGLQQGVIYWRIAGGERLEIAGEIKGRVLR
jgi:hypothetical protein